VQGGEHEVLQEVDLLGVDDAGVDADRQELTGPGHVDLDLAAGCLAGDDLAGLLLLGRHHLLLDGLGLAQQRSEVQPLQRVVVLLAHRRRPFVVSRRR
jgi:hypothetical protein